MIRFDEKNRIFQLDTKNTSYLIGIVDTEGFVGHIYYGARIPAGQDLSYLLRIYEKPFVPSVNAGDRGSFLDAFPSEYPGDGLGDYSTSTTRRKRAAILWK